MKSLFPLFLLFILVLTGCHSSSLDDYQEEGEAVIRSLIQELKKIHTRHELVRATPSLQKLFDRLVSVMVAAEEFRLSHQESIKGSEVRVNHDLSDQLRVELNRIYRLEGGRQIIEKCQERGLCRISNSL